MNKMTTMLFSFLVSSFAIAADLSGGTIIKIKSNELGAFVQVKLKSENSFRLYLCSYTDLYKNGCEARVPDSIENIAVEKIWIGANYGLERGQSVLDQSGSSEPAFFDLSELIQMNQSKKSGLIQRLSLSFTDESEKTAKLYLNKPVISEELPMLEAYHNFYNKYIEIDVSMPWEKQ